MIYENNIHCNDSTIYNDRKMWRTVQNMVGKEKQVPPRNLVIDGKATTSLRKICNHANQFYINKVNKLRENFSNTFNASPLDVLQKLIPRTKGCLKIPYIDANGFKKLLKKAKASNFYEYS